MNKNKKGFGFFEILLTLALCSIIGSAFVPVIRHHIVKKDIDKAFVGLTKVQVAMEQGYLRNGLYGKSGQCPVTMPTARTFSFDCEVTNKGRSFIVSAISTGFHGLRGYRYSVDAEGNRQTAEYPNTKVPVNCWLNDKGVCSRNLKA